MEKYFLDHILSKCIISVLNQQTIIDLNRQLLFRNFATSIYFIVISELMLFGERLVLARKKRKISQEELAKRLSVHAPIIGRYERGEVKPSVEIAAKIAKALDVSLDYLVGNSDAELDQKLANTIIDIQKLNEKDKNHIIVTINALLRDAKARAAYS